MILLLHTLIEGLAGLIFLFYPDAANFVPGFADGEGQSFLMLMKMYGLAALLLAGLSLTGWFQRENRSVLLIISALLAAFHLGMTIVQAIYNPVPQAMLLHFMLFLFLSGQYIKERKKSWVENAG